MANILVVDDEIGIRELLSEILYDEGHVVSLAENAEQARQYRLKQRPDLVLLDIWMPDTDGVTLLKEWALNNLLTMPVIMMSGHASIDTAVEATRMGALDFLEKPITLDKLLTTVAQGLLRSGAPDIKNIIHQMAAPNHAQLDAKRASVHSLDDIEMVGSVGAASVVQHAQTVGLQLNTTEVVYENFAPQSGLMGLEEHKRKLIELDFNLPLREARDYFEQVYFEYHLQRENTNITRVAERTGLERTHLYRKLKQLGISISKANKQK